MIHKRQPINDPVIYLLESFLSVWGVSRVVTRVSKVTYQGNKGNKCGLTGGQKLVKSRTL